MKRNICLYFLLYEKKSHSPNFSILVRHFFTISLKVHRLKPFSPGLSFLLFSWECTLLSFQKTIHLTQKKVKSLLDKELDLFSEFRLHRLLGSAREVGGALGDAAKDQGVPLRRHLLGNPARLPVDRLHADLLARLVTPVKREPELLCKILRYVGN